MELRRTFALTKRTLYQFRHDRRTLGFVLFMPLLMILIFGYTFGGDVKNVDVELINQDEGAVIDNVPMATFDFYASNEMIANLDGETLDIHETDDVVEAKKKVDEGDAWALVLFPANFTEKLMEKLENGEGVAAPSVEIYLDGSNPNMAGAVIKAVNEAIIDTIDTMAQQFNQTGIEMPIGLTTEYAYAGEDTQFIDYFAPGIISFAIMMVTIMLTIILFVNERRTGTLERLLASPASETEIVLGYAMAFGMIGLLQSIVVITAAILIFGIVVEGSVFLALFVALLLALGHQGLGILLSSAAKNELQAVQFIPLIIFPSILLAGLFWPIESIPEFLQPIADFVPLRYGIDAMRSIMLRGWGLADILVEVLILVFFAILTLGGSILLLKRRR